jgi:hypothetical protein
MVDDPIEEPLISAKPSDLSLSERPDRNSQDSAGARPGLIFEISPDASRDHEPTWTGVRIDCALDRTEYFRDDLPLIDQQRSWPSQQRRIRVRSKGHRFGGAVQSSDVNNVARGWGGLPGRARTGDDDCRGSGY